MKTLGLGKLVLHHNSVREPFYPAKFEKLYPLLALQPYFSEVVYEEKFPGHGKCWDFNPFRNRNWECRGNTPESLCESHFRIFKLPEFLKDEPWLKVDTAVNYHGKTVVFHRSARYHNSIFPWRKIWAAYHPKAIFVGLPDEHLAFEREIGKVDYLPTATYLELARVIAGCSLFVGNQSCPYAIAEGLKVTAILEAFPYAQDCQFVRPGLQNNPNGRIQLIPV